MVMQGNNSYSDMIDDLNYLIGLQYREIEGQNDKNNEIKNYFLLKSNIS